MARVTHGAAIWIAIVAIAKVSAKNYEFFRVRPIFFFCVDSRIKEEDWNFMGFPGPVLELYGVLKI